MKSNFLRAKGFAVTLLLAISAGAGAFAQLIEKDSLQNARVGSTQTINGTVTYDGTGAGTGGTEGTYVGYNAGRITTGNWNSFFGANSGYSNTSGASNSFSGRNSGYSATSANSNSFFGTNAGYYTTTGGTNSFFGSVAGYHNTTGNDNTFMGFYTGYGNTVGIRNVYIGGTAGYVNSTGNNNTMLGNRAGFTNTSGSGNVFLGYYSGGQETGSNKLYIANSNTVTPLVYGDFTDSKLVINGKTGVGTSNFPTSVGGADVSAYKLFVKGGILAEEVRVRTNWADYVFKDNYNLKPLSEVENYINVNGHLPNVPSEKVVDKDGISIGEIARIQQEKIEELTLYLIEMQKKLNVHEKEIERLKGNSKKTN